LDAYKKKEVKKGLKSTIKSCVDQDAVKFIIVTCVMGSYSLATGAAFVPTVFENCGKPLSEATNRKLMICCGTSWYAVSALNKANECRDQK